MHRVVSASSTTRTVRRGGRPLRIAIMPKVGGNIDTIGLFRQALYLEQLGTAQSCSRPPMCRAGTSELHRCKRYSTVTGMKRIFAAAFVTSAAAAALAAAQQPAPIFRAGTTLVEFTIAAFDERGQPATDLQPGEITVVQNGKPQPVAFFRFEGSAFAPGAVEPKPEPIAPGIFTNRVEYSAGPLRNVTAIVIDSLNTLPEDQIAMKAQVMQYLRVLAPNTRVAVYALGSNLRILHDFTNDLDALRARLAKHNIELNIQSIRSEERRVGK